MSARLKDHYPPDSTFREEAVAQVAARLISEGEVAALIEELLDDSPARIRRLERAVDAEIADLRRLDNLALTDEDMPE